MRSNETLVKFDTELQGFWYLNKPALPTNSIANPVAVKYTPRLYRLHHQPLVWLAASRRGDRQGRGVADCLHGKARGHVGEGDAANQRLVEIIERIHRRHHDPE